MRFGISATSLIDPKNFLTRLRPVNVCAIVSLSIRLWRAALAPLPTAAIIAAIGTGVGTVRFYVIRVGPNRRTLRTFRDRTGPPGTARSPDPSISPCLLSALPGPRPGRILLAGLDPRSARGKDRASAPLSGSRAAAREPAFGLNSPRSLELNLGAHLFERGLDLGRLLLGDAFLDRLRRALDQILGLLQAETGNGANLFDDLDLLLAGAGEHDRKLGLLFRRRRRAAGRGRGARRHRDRGSRRDSPFLFQHLGQVRRLEDGQAGQFVNDLLQVSHCSVPVVGSNQGRAAGG